MREKRSKNFIGDFTGRRETRFGLPHYIFFSLGHAEIGLEIFEELQPARNAPKKTFFVIA